MATFVARVREKLPSSLLTYVLFCLFGVGSWVAVNGVWAEISILSSTLPECLCLPAALVVVIQVANIGPLLYTVIKIVHQKKGYRMYRLEVATVFVLVTIGFLACVCLALFWNKTAQLGGTEHSVSLIVISLFLAVVDCTSSVVFLPFMKHFPSQYLSALYIGEGLSGVLPSAVALSQGFINTSTCLHHYTDYTKLGLNFSPNVFFVLLAVLMLVCGASFLLINTLPSSRAIMLSHTTSISTSPTEETEGLVDTHLALQDITPSTKTSLLHTTITLLRKHFTVYICIAVINFLTNGTLSAISSFALFPYGTDVYHIAVNLALLATPLLSAVYVLLPHKSPVFTAVLSGLAVLLGVYMLEAALLNPPPLHTQTIGKLIIVCVNVSIAGLVAYAKVGAMVQLHSGAVHKDMALFLAGLITQLGSLLGAILFFVLVYFTTIFPPCAD